MWRAKQNRPACQVGHACHRFAIPVLHKKDMSDIHVICDIDMGCVTDLICDIDMI